MFKSVKLKITDNDPLEAVIPPDRVIEISEDGRCFLDDCEFIIPESAIEKIVWEAK